MNVVAGILIGVVNDSWTARLVAPFLWGVVFVIYQMVFGTKTNSKLLFIEYLTATFTSLFFSVVTGFIRTLFIK